MRRIYALRDPHSFYT